MRGAKTPLWLAKGLACQFEIPQPDAHGALKRVNQMRLGDFREALGAQRNGDGARTLWQQAVEAGKMMALPDLIGADQFEGDGLTLAARYAQSWALVHYLHREHSRGFEKYLARLAARQTGHEISIQEELADFAAAFGPADTGVANAWVTYILRLRYDGTDR